MKQILKSTCNLCSGGCGVLIILEDGQPVGVKGDPDCSANEGKLCMKGLASLKYLYHPDRLSHPLKRKGKRGENEWEKISWEEALDTIANKLTRTKEDCGAESLAMLHGSAKGFQDNYLKRLASVFGTPNVATQSHVCFVPMVKANQITTGFVPVPDFDYPPACIILWGCNASETRVVQMRTIIRAREKGTKIVVVDPRETDLSKKANFWLRPRPGSDLALALSILNVIISDSLFDRDFVDRWTVGFDKLSDSIQNYTPEKVEKIVWISADTIREVASFYATNKPACIETGNGIETNVNSFQTLRAISILSAITGNLGVPGGQVQWSNSPVTPRHSPILTLHDRLPPGQWEKRVGVELNLIPGFNYVVPQSIIKAIVQENPYPIRSMYIQGCNPLITYPNAFETYDSLKKLDFLAVSELFMTPVAALADIVLPAATYLEFDNVVAAAYSTLVKAQQKVTQIGECWSDYHIINKLAAKLNLKEYFGDDEEQFLDLILKPSGLTFTEFRKVETLNRVKQYRKHEKEGFATPSGRVELSSSQLEKWGFDALPIYQEPPETPYSAPELFAAYPLILTSWKSAPFIHSSGRQIDVLRGRKPEPIVYIHPDTATLLKVRTGDSVWIETTRGKIKQKAHLTTGIDPRVIAVDYGWWFPEKGEGALYGWADSNVNILTDNQPPYNREMGSTNLRGLLCRVRPTGDEICTRTDILPNYET